MPTEPLTPRYLWQTLRAYLSALFDLFGSPQAIAQRQTLPRAEHRALAQAIAALEHLLRRLLLMDALALTPSLPCEAKRRPRRAPAARAAFDPQTPERWSAPFALTPSRPAQSRAGEAPRLRPPWVSTVALALRMEALVRGFNDPAPLAQRLANKLAADSERAIAACLRPPSRLVASHPYGRIVADATDAARAALAAPPAPAADTS